MAATETFWDIALDPAHIAAELVWSLIFDGLFVALLYGVIWKRYLLPRLRRQLHKELDAEHGIVHHDADRDSHDRL